MSKVYYNEHDPKTADWLEDLISRNLLPAGYVDRRSIEDILPSELDNYDQCHFFAGIGGWPLALQLSKWPKNGRIWTGSCPCQPFSSPGSKKGFNDRRHLWPAFYWLIKQCRPDFVVGEQVAKQNGYMWWDAVQSDLKNNNYTCGVIAAEACCFKGWHKRERLYWVATNADGKHEYNVFNQSCEERGGKIAQEQEVDSVDIDFGHGVGRKRFPKPPSGWLDDGIPDKLAIRGYGNAIFIPQAVAFLDSVVECMS